MTLPGVRVVRGEPTDTEVVALVAGLAAAATVRDAAVEDSPCSRWNDPARTLRTAPWQHADARAETWRWSLR